MASYPWLQTIIIITVIITVIATVTIIKNIIILLYKVQWTSGIGNLHATSKIAFLIGLTVSIKGPHNKLKLINKINVYHRQNWLTLRLCHSFLTFKIKKTRLEVYDHSLHLRLHIQSYTINIASYRLQKNWDIYLFCTHLNWFECISNIKLF